MKKTLSLVLALAVLATICLTFASCGKKLSGKYSADFLGTGTTLAFDGSNVKIAITVTFLGEVASVDATYEIKDDQIIFEIADEENAYIHTTEILLKTVCDLLAKPELQVKNEDYLERKEFYMKNWLQKEHS